MCVFIIIYCYKIIVAVPLFEAFDERSCFKPILFKYNGNFSQHKYIFKLLSLYESREVFRNSITQTL